MFIWTARSMSSIPRPPAQGKAWLGLQGRRSWNKDLLSPHPPIVPWPPAGTKCTGGPRGLKPPQHRGHAPCSALQMPTRSHFPGSATGVNAQALIFVKSLGNPWRGRTEYYYEIIAFYSAPSESSGSLFGPALSKPRVKT